MCSEKNFNSKKEKQAKRVLTWTELKPLGRADNAFCKRSTFYESSILAQDERWRRA